MTVTSVICHKHSHTDNTDFTDAGKASQTAWLATVNGLVRRSK